jgi:polysaccharide pyruvyl transferase WcaK-like protein
LLRDIPESSYIVCDDLSLSDLKPVFEQLDYFVGMRFHSLLASTIFQTPFIALEYDTKCTRLMQDMRYPHSVLLEKFTSDSAVKKLHKLSVSRQSSIEKQQSEYVDSQKEIMARIKKKLTL